MLRIHLYIYLTIIIIISNRSRRMQTYLLKKNYNLNSALLNRNNSDIPSL